MNTWYEQLFTALHEAEVRYVVVGGVAVVLHGHARLTVDVDLVIDLEPTAALRTIEVLQGLGLKPVAPVPARSFADPEVRERWVEEKHMVVFSMVHPSDPTRVVDLFARNPMPFEELWQRSQLVYMSGCPVRVAALADLIAMKQAAGRSEDLADVALLRTMVSDPGGTHG